MKQTIILLIIFISTYAQTFTLGVSEFEPNIIYKNGTVVGYDIDIWNEVAKRADLDFEIKKYERFDDLISDVDNGKVDGGMAGITITSQRERQFDFSYPYMRSNLAVLSKPSGVDIVGVFVMFIQESWTALIVLLVYMLIFSTLIWLAEYGKESFSDNFWYGMLDGMYFVNTTTTSTGYGDKTPQTILGKIISVIIMWIGIGVIFPYITGQMSNIISQYNTTVQVADFDDLVGKKKAVVKHTTSEDLMIQENLKYESMDNIDRCLRLLENEEIDMVIYDESLLRYIDKLGQYHIQPLRPIIQNYGIALSEDNEYKDKIDIAILQIIEDGTYQTIYDRWYKGKSK